SPSQLARRDRGVPARDRRHTGGNGAGRPGGGRPYPLQPHLHELSAAAALRRPGRSRKCGRAPLMRPSPITPTVDFDRDGVQHGLLKLPYSRDDSAWGAVMIPIAVIKRGDGPTALLTGANHGDEYEGPIALFELANRLRADEVSGRVIVVPAM